MGTTNNGNTHPPQVGATKKKCLPMKEFAVATSTERNRSLSTNQQMPVEKKQNCGLAWRACNYWGT